MGQKFSRNITEEEEEEENYSTWGSDIDNAICGPGKLCADEWTPLSSRNVSPHRISDEGLRNDEAVITEQPYLSKHPSLIENVDIIQFKNDSDENQIINNERKKIKNLKKKNKKKKKNLIHLIIEINNQKYSKKVDSLSSNPIYLKFPDEKSGKKPRKSQKIQQIIKFRRRRVRDDPRYPPISPPNVHPRIKFKNGEYSKKKYRTIAVRPNRSNGIYLSPPPHFRYRGIKN